MRLLTIRRTFEEGECHPFYFWGDWHAFNGACAKGELRKDREQIRTTPNALYANMGDNGDFIGHDDRRFKAAHLDQELMSLDDLDELGDKQVEWLTEFEAPVIDRCVVALGSNHPGKFDRLHHTNTMKRKLRALGRQDLWCAGGCLLRIVYTDAHRHSCEVVMNLHHGTKTARYPSTLLNALLIKARYWPTVDVIARGHCHFCRSDHQERITTNRTHTDLASRRIFVFLTGGYLKTFRVDGENYAEDMDLDPIDIGVARLDIYPSRHGARLQAVT